MNGQQEGFRTMAKPKRETNEQFVKRVMNFSRYGALSQIFIMQALDSYSKAVANADPDKCGNALINGEAWVNVAKELQAELMAHYAN